MGSQPRRERLVPLTLLKLFLLVCSSPSCLCGLVCLLVAVPPASLGIVALLSAEVAPQGAFLVCKLLQLGVVGLPFPSFL